MNHLINGKNLAKWCVMSLFLLALPEVLHAACLDQTIPNLEGSTYLCTGGYEIEKIKIEAKMKSQIPSSEDGSPNDCQYQFDLLINDVPVKDPYDDLGNHPIAFTSSGEGDHSWTFYIAGPKMLLTSYFRDGKLLGSMLSDMPFVSNPVHYPPVTCELTLKSGS